MNKNSASNFLITKSLSSWFHEAVTVHSWTHLKLSISINCLLKLILVANTLLYWKVSFRLGLFIQLIFISVLPHTHSIKSWTFVYTSVTPKLQLDDILLHFNYRGIVIIWSLSFFLETIGLKRNKTLSLRYGDNL